MDTTIADIMHALYGLVCHQSDAPLGACPRCIGLHLGLALGWWRANLAHPRGAVGPRASVLLLAAPAAMLVHWWLGAAGLIEPSQTGRLVTGATCGASLGVLGASLLHAGRRAAANGHRGRAAAVWQYLLPAAIIAAAAAALPSIAIAAGATTSLQTLALAALLSNIAVLAASAGRLIIRTNIGGVS